MADMLNSGVSGLLAMQRALDVTSHNIANASTAGYSRQRVDLAAVLPADSGGGEFVGRGVNVLGVRRSYDELLANQQRSAAGNYSRLDTYASRAQTLSNLFGDSATGLSASLQRFTNAVQGVANTPTSTAARQVLLSEAEGLKQRLQTYDNRLQEISVETNTSIKNEATTISDLAARIATLNQQIVSTQNQTGQQPNDLMDARDQQIDELSRHVSVSIQSQGDGTLNVYIGKGQPLVLGTRAASIVAQSDRYDVSRMSLVYKSGSTYTNLGDTSSSLGDTLSGGSLGGLLDFRTELLDPARNQLGQVTVGLASVVNAQHREGQDLAGNMGGDLFSVGGVRVLPASSNAGSGSVSISRTSASALTANDYVLQYTGGAWALRRADTGVAVALTGTGTAADPFQAEGLAFVVGGTPATGDSYKLQPTAGAISGLQVLVTDATKVAAAAPIRSSVAFGNKGGVTISAGEVLDATAPQLRGTVNIAFTSSNTYTLNGTGSYTLPASGIIAANGWMVQLSGTPAAGDGFVVQSNTGGTGDNRNALEIARMLDTGVLTGGAESLTGAVSRMVGAVGVATNQAQNGRDTQKLILEDTTSARDGVQGVNLDEEAANMMRFQQAYQATAQVIKATQTLFDTLLQATR